MNCKQHNFLEREKMCQPPSSYFMATGRVFNKVLSPSIPGFLEQSIRPVSELSVYAGFKEMMCLALLNIGLKKLQSIKGLNPPCPVRVPFLYTVLTCIFVITINLLIQFFHRIKGKSTFF